MKRTPIRRIGRRRERELDELAAFRQNPPERCERCRGQSALQPHHRLPKSRGGQNTTENRAWLCPRCHRGVHDHTLTDWRTWIQ